jgi:hypothetical protein
MLQTTTHFANKVGVAPGTTTLTLGCGAQRALGIQCLPEPGVPAPGMSLDWRPGPRSATSAKNKFYEPYKDKPMLTTSGLGIISEGDRWRTGEPYGLPGTATIRLRKRPDGSYDSSLMGAHLGDVDAATATVLTQLVKVQEEQAKAVKRIAFWTSLSGGIGVVAIGLGVLGAVLSVRNGRI